MSKEDFDTYWKTHLVTSVQGCNVSQMTVLYWHATKEEASNFPWTRREGTFKIHATAAVARDLLTQVRVATRKNVLTATLIQNYSPCSRCTEEILKVISLARDKRIKFEISIAFVALNGIRRPSWVWRGMEAELQRVPINESNDNSFALRQLQEAGVKLSTFNPDMWKFLDTFLGNGLPMDNPGKFLAGKYSNPESRFDEDRFMEVDLRQTLRGLTLTSSSNDSSNSTLIIDWSRPGLTPEKVSEYKVVCKKVTVKNKEDEERSWRIQQTIDNIAVKVNMSGDVASCQITDLELDTFYDVTVEAFVKGLPACMGRKLFKTGNRVPIPSLQTPTMTRKLSSSSRPRTSSAASFINVTAVATPTRLKRSNSIQCAPQGTLSSANELETAVKDTDADSMKRSVSGSASNHFSPGGVAHNGTKASTFAKGLFRSSFSRSLTLERSQSSSEDSKSKMAGTCNAPKHVINGRNISNSSSIDSTVL